MSIFHQAIHQGRTVLSETESKEILAQYHIPVTREFSVNTEKELVRAVEELGFPLVLKGESHDIAHKTESGLIQTRIKDMSEACRIYARIKKKMNGKGSVLVQEMIQGEREFVIGMTRDPQFGPCVMFGLGGIFTEVFNDVVFRVAPLTTGDAMSMMQEIRASKILGPVRGMEAVDLDALSHIIIQVGQIGMDHDPIKEIDINPVIISGDKGVAVDALIILESE